MIGHRLNKTLTVYRPSLTADGAGGHTENLVNVGTIQAQVSQPAAEERTTAAQRGANLTHVVHALPTANVERGDRLTGNGPEPLRVKAVIQNSRATYKRLECEVTQSEG